MGKNKVATAKHMHCQVTVYIPLGVGHTSSYTDRYLRGWCCYVLLKPLCCFCLGIRYNSGYRDPGKLRDIHGLGSTQWSFALILKSCRYMNNNLLCLVSGETLNLFVLCQQLNTFLALGSTKTLNIPQE